VLFGKHCVYVKVLMLKIFISDFIKMSVIYCPVSNQMFYLQTDAS
jgi:hypothetical protein